MQDSQGVKTVCWSMENAIARMRLEKWNDPKKGKKNSSSDLILAQLERRLSARHAQVVLSAVEPVDLVLVLPGGLGAEGADHVVALLAVWPGVQSTTIRAGHSSIQLSQIFCAQVGALYSDF